MLDAVAANGKLLIHAVSEHVENAGVHSGDATLILPPVSLSESDMSCVLWRLLRLVTAPGTITGPFNIQIIKAHNPDNLFPDLKVIECNIRASRSFPFVSKVLGANFINVATRALLNKDVLEPVDPYEAVL